MSSKKNAYLTSNLCPIVVSSCDQYSDIWPQFFHFLFSKSDLLASKVPIYLITQKKQFHHPRVISFKTGVDHGWATNLKKCLTVIDSDYFIYLQEDYLLKNPLQYQALDSLVNSLREKKGKYLSLTYGKLYQAEACLEQSTIAPLSLENNWFLDLQAGIWYTQTFQQFIKETWNPWEAESGLNRKAKANPDGFYAIVSKEKFHLDYIQAIKGRFWLKDAVNFCRKEKIPIDLKTRPCPPWGETFFKKLYRSFLKRILTLRHFRNRFLGDKKEVYALKLPQ